MGLSPILGASTEQSIRYFERAAQYTLEDARNLSVRHSVSREVHNLIAEAGFEENDFRCQRTNVVWSRKRHAGLKTAQRVHCTAFEVNHLEYRLELFANRIKVLVLDGVGIWLQHED